jgi:decaprenylphospho-beta-D-ribofuranose 2-oxidase
MLINGWGRTPVIEADVALPRTTSETIAALTNFGNRPVIARGLGRSYGDSALNSHVIGTSYLNLLSDFDAGSGKVRCGAGVSLADLVETFLPRGWFLPVTPGTRFVTVGGAIASDVHGKNHHISGCFSEYVDEFKIAVASGDLLTCSRSENTDLFHATCGGMGLTGVIVEAVLALVRVSGSLIQQETVKCANLRDTLEAIESSASSAYSVAWTDCLATGNTLGRSHVMTGEHTNEGALDAAAPRALPIPFDLPSWALNRWSIKAFNALYYRRGIAKRDLRRVHYTNFFYPLDGLANWNRMYGRQGFTQYQFVVPKAAGFDAINNILGKIAASERGSFLSVLKLLGAENHNPLSFPMEGYTLALDFKMDAEIPALLEELDAMVLDHGGRIYLTKDCRLSAKAFRRGYPRWEAFEAVRTKYGATGRFSSLQSRRIGFA